MLSSCSYVYFIFFKLKVLCNCYVSVLHYNSDSDIRIHERMNKFHTLKTSHTNRFFPTRVLVLPILSPLQRSTRKFWMKLRYQKQDPNSSTHSWQLQVHDKSEFSCTELVALFGIQLWDQFPASPVGSIRKFVTCRSCELPKLTEKKPVLWHWLDIKE